MYQKIVVLDRSMRYKLDLVVQDLKSGSIGAIKQAIVTPSLEPERFAISSVMLSDFVRDVDDPLKDDSMFVLGDVWIRPSLNKRFSQDAPVAVYLQLYNFGLDQSSLTPQIEAEFRVLKDRKTVLEVDDRGGESVHFFSGERIIFLRHLPTNILQPGKYALEVRVRDLIKDQEVTAVEQFQLGGPSS